MAQRDGGSETGTKAGGAEAASAAGAYAPSFSETGNAAGAGPDARRQTGAERDLVAGRAQGGVDQAAHTKAVDRADEAQGTVRERVPASEAGGAARGGDPSRKVELKVDVREHSNPGAEVVDGAFGLGGGQPSAERVANVEVNEVEPAAGPDGTEGKRDGSGDGADILGPTAEARGGDDAGGAKGPDDDAGGAKASDDAGGTRASGDDAGGAKGPDDDAGGAKASDDAGGTRASGDDAGGAKGPDDDAGGVKASDDAGGTRASGDDAGGAKGPDDDAGGVKASDDAGGAKGPDGVGNGTDGAEGGDASDAQRLAEDARVDAAIEEGLRTGDMVRPEEGGLLVLGDRQQSPEFAEFYRTHREFSTAETAFEKSLEANGFDLDVDVEHRPESLEKRQLTWLLMQAEERGASDTQLGELGRTASHYFEARDAFEASAEPFARASNGLLGQHFGRAEATDAPSTSNTTGAEGPNLDRASVDVASPGDRVNVNVNNVINNERGDARAYRGGSGDGADLNLNLRPDLVQAVLSGVRYGMQYGLSSARAGIEEVVDGQFVQGGGGGGRGGDGRSGWQKVKDGLKKTAGVLVTLPVRALTYIVGENAKVVGDAGLSVRDSWRTRSAASPRILASPGYDARSGRHGVHLTAAAQQDAGDRSINDDVAAAAASGR